MQIAAESPAETPMFSAKRSVFTSANAREMQQRGLLARKTREFTMEEENKRLKRLADIGLQALEPHTVITGDEFRDKTLTRVRERIEATLDKLSDAELPAIDQERLSRSLGVLLEHEGHLSGRPKSGVRKPVVDKPKRSPASYPEPIPQFQVAPAPDIPPADPEMPSI